MNTVRFVATTLEVGATALWVGASSGFAFVSAPVAFGLISDRDMFAELTQRTLGRLAVLTYAAGGGSSLVALLRASFERDGRVNDAFRGITGCAALACIAYHQRAIVPAMTRAQAEMGGSFTAIAADDPQRILYGALHRRSTRAYGTALALGIVVLVLAATRGNPSSDQI